MIVMPGTILQVFFDAEPKVLALATGPLRLVGATMALEVVGQVLLNAMMGAGATRMAMAVSVLAQWALFLPAAYLIGPVFGFGLTRGHGQRGAFRAGAPGPAGRSGRCARTWRPRPRAGPRCRGPHGGCPRP